MIIRIEVMDADWQRLFEYELETEDADSPIRVPDKLKQIKGVYGIRQTLVQSKSTSISSSVSG